MYSSSKVTVKRQQLIEENDEEDETTVHGPLMSLQGGQLNQTDRSFHRHRQQHQQQHGSDTNWLATIDSRFFSKKKRFCALFILLLLFAIICTILTLSFLPYGTTANNNNLAEIESAEQNVLPLTGHGQEPESGEKTVVMTTSQGGGEVTVVTTKSGENKIDADDARPDSNSLESQEYFAKYFSKSAFRTVSPPSPKFLGNLVRNGSLTPNGMPKTLRYYLSEAPVNQTEAQNRCEKLGPGGTLFSPLSLDEFVAMDKLLRASRVPETWLLWTAGHLPTSPPSASWSWLPNMTVISEDQLISPKFANLTHFETFSRPLTLLPLTSTSSSEVTGSGPLQVAGGLTMFRRKMDFGFCKRYANEIHDFACQVDVS